MLVLCLKNGFLTETLLLNLCVASTGCSGSAVFVTVRMQLSEFQNLSKLFFNVFNGAARTTTSFQILTIRLVKLNVSILYFGR